MKRFLLILFLLPTMAQAQTDADRERWKNNLNMPDATIASNILTNCMSLNDIYYYYGNATISEQQNSVLLLTYKPSKLIVAINRTNFCTNCICAPTRAEIMKISVVWEEQLKKVAKQGETDLQKIKTNLEDIKTFGRVHKLDVIDKDWTMRYAVALSTNEKEILLNYLTDTSPWVRQAARATLAKTYKQDFGPILSDITFAQKAQTDWKKYFEDGTIVATPVVPKIENRIPDLLNPLRKEK